jgi:acetate kinase
VRVLVVNAGSSSLKLRLLDHGDEVVAERTLETPGSELDPELVAETLDATLSQADAVGHRIVHGGERFRAAARIDAGLVAELHALSELAPLHQPKSLAALAAVGRAMPDTPAVACFDTAFHATLSPEAATYALPAAWRKRWPLRRFGFHGLSHAWVAWRAPELLGERAPASRIVSCHLGAGASLCAIRDGQSIDTTMGFTPLEGLVMATRAGSVDPGLLVWLIERKGLDVGALAHALEHESGLAGLAGSGDMRAVLSRAESGDEASALALGVYLHRLRAGIGSMAAALGGLDVLVFTGGVGERAPAIRAGAVDGLGFLGVAVDAERNAACNPDAEIGAGEAPVQTLVLEAREDIEIARQVRALLGDTEQKERR